MKHMSNPSPKKIIRSITLIIFVFVFCSVLLAQESTNEVQYYQEKAGLSLLEQQARDYRSKGLQLQKMGNLGEALSYYQKAIVIDPNYPVPYNDLGIMYEGMGQIDLAESNYLTSVKVDPYYVSAYSNLAMLCENKRDLNKAAFFWQKRACLGSPYDPWTTKARERLEDIRLVLGKKSAKSREQQVIDLAKDVSTQKGIYKNNNKEYAKYYLDKARLSYQKGDQTLAFKEAINAKQLDPSNKEIDDFIEKIQTRLLSK